MTDDGKMIKDNRLKYLNKYYSFYFILRIYIYLA